MLILIRPFSVGTALMKHLHGVAASRSIGQLSADVSRAAEHFFVSHGFHVVTRKTVTVRGVPLQHARMHKRLSLAGMHEIAPDERI